MDHLADGRVDPLDGQEHLPAQEQAHQDRGQDAQQEQGQADRVQQVQGILGEGLGLAEHHVQAGGWMGNGSVGKLLRSAVQGLSLQKSGAQAVRQGDRLAGLSAVDRPPVGAEEQQVVAGAERTAEQTVQVRLGQADHKVTKGSGFPGLKRDGPLEQRSAGGGRVLRRGEHQTARPAGGRKEAPVGGELLGAEDASGGAEPGPLGAVQVEAGLAADRFGHLQKAAVHRRLLQLLRMGESLGESGIPLDGQGRLNALLAELLQGSGYAGQLFLRLPPGSVLQTDPQDLEQHPGA